MSQKTNDDNEKKKTEEDKKNKEIMAEFEDEAGLIPKSTYIPQQTALTPCTNAED